MGRFPHVLALTLLGLALAACSSEERQPDEDAGAAGGPSESDSLLYVGPHPDDEFYAAPLFGHLCRASDWACTFVVATRGEGGSCGLPEGCDPDLATVRGEEMVASAELLGAELIHWDLGDNGHYEPYPGDVEDVLQLWAERAGSGAALIAMVQQVISDTSPDVIYTMDPRHGNYCHPSHRAIGALVVQAVQELGGEAPETRMLAAKWFEEGAFGFRPLVPGDPSLQNFDATVHSDHLGNQAWLYVLRVLQAHRSQFDVSAVTDEMFLGTLAEHKRIWWAPLDAAVTDDPLYGGLCAPSTF